MAITDREVVIEVSELAKSFDGVQAVSNVGFTIFKGELFGFLGPNGAGKTTTINMITGLARPDRGFIKIAGVDCSKSLKAAQGEIGIVPDDNNLYPELTGFQNLAFCGALYNMSKMDRENRARDLLSVFGLSKAADRKFGGYSKGMKRKLTIAAGIMHNPSILFLDEPTTGIDVISASQIRNLIKDLNEKGTTIFLTTHYLEEAQRLCDRIAFINAGEVVRIDTLDNFMNETSGCYRLEFEVSENSPDLCNAVSEKFPELVCSEISSKILRIECSEPVGIGPIIASIEARGVYVYEARKIRPSLEDVFVRITGVGESDHEI